MANQIKVDFVGHSYVRRLRRADRGRNLDMDRRRHVIDFIGERTDHHGVRRNISHIRDLSDLSLQYHQMDPAQIVIMEIGTNDLADDYHSTHQMADSIVDVANNFLAAGTRAVVIAAILPRTAYGP